MKLNEGNNIVMIYVLLSWKAGFRISHNGSLSDNHFYQGNFHSGKSGLSDCLTGVYAPAERDWFFKATSVLWQVVIIISQSFKYLFCSFDRIDMFLVIKEVLISNPKIISSMGYRNWLVIQKSLKIKISRHNGPAKFLVYI